MADDKKASLASGLDRYGEGVKWLVSLATGTVALALGFFKDTELRQIEQLAFSAAVAVLLVAVFAGVLCGLNVVAYATHAEAEERAKERLGNAAADANKAGRSSVDAATKALEAARAAKEKGRQNASWMWPTTLWTFAFGMFAFFGFAGLRVWRPILKEERLHLTPVTATANGRTTYLLFDADTGRLYRLVLHDSVSAELIEVHIR